MTTVSLDQASRTVESLIVKLRQAEAERDDARVERNEANRHLRNIVLAFEYNNRIDWGDPANYDLHDAIHESDFFLKGGL